MRNLFFVAIAVFCLNTFADDTTGNLPEGVTVLGSISRKVGKIFEPGAILCAQDLTQPGNTYEFGYSFKNKESLEVLEYSITPDTDGPANVLASRNEFPDMNAGALVLDDSKTKLSPETIAFSGDSVSISFKDGTFGLFPVASVAGTLNLQTMKLEIVVIGQRTQNLVLDCLRMD